MKNPKKSDVKTEKKSTIGTFCFVCGNKETTIHHMRISEIKSKKNRGKCQGIIYLCEECHKIVEDIVNKGKSRKIWYKEGYEEGLKESGRDLLYKDNHIVGCLLEGFESVLRFRGFDEEGDMLMKIASRIK